MNPKKLALVGTALTGALLAMIPSEARADLIPPVYPTTQACTNPLASGNLVSDCGFQNDGANVVPSSPWVVTNSQATNFNDRNPGSSFIDDGITIAPFSGHNNFVFANGCNITADGLSATTCATDSSATYPTTDNSINGGVGTYNGLPNVLATLSQDTTAGTLEGDGTTLNLGFWLQVANSSNPAINQFDVFWNGVNIDSMLHGYSLNTSDTTLTPNSDSLGTNMADSGGVYEFFYASGLTTRGTNSLTFSGYNDPGEMALADVCVLPDGSEIGITCQTADLPFNNDEPAVPEPASLSLLGAGIIGLGLLRRRKRA